MTVLIARSSFPAFRSLAGRQVPSAPSLAVVALVVWTVPLWFAAAPVGAYRFDPAERRVSLVPRSEDATRWKASVWGPGESLTWRVLDDGGWSPHFADASQVVAKLSSAAAAWTEIPTADIKWRVAGVTTRPSARGRDGRNVMSVEDLDGFGGYASWWADGSGPGGAWQITECDIRVDPGFVGALATDENGGGLRLLVHELGHCVGLHHAAVGPASGNGFGLRTDGSLLPGPDPRMSYGQSTPDSLLSEDDAIGASLLRPAPEWIRTTGGVSGIVTLDGAPAPFVSVQLLVTAGGSTRRRVQVFSDEAGRFLAEGLAPGVYLLWVHPVIGARAHPALIRTGSVPLDLIDTLAVQPAVVQRGEVTTTGEFPLRRGCRRPG